MKPLISDRLILQILHVRDLYSCDIYDIALMREYSYMDSLTELYSLLSEYPEEYYKIVSNGYGMDL